MSIIFPKKNVPKSNFRSGSRADALHWPKISHFGHVTNHPACPFFFLNPVPPGPPPPPAATTFHSTLHVCPGSPPGGGPRQRAGHRPQACRRASARPGPRGFVQSPGPALNLSSRPVKSWCPKMGRTISGRCQNPGPLRHEVEADN